MTYEVSSKRAKRVVRFIEEFLVVPEGKDVGKPVVLRDWQLEFIDKVYSTPTRRAILSMGRKNGMSAITHDHAAPGPLGRADGVARVRHVSGAAGAGGHRRDRRRSRRLSALAVDFIEQARGTCGRSRRPRWWPDVRSRDVV